MFALLYLVLRPWHEAYARPRSASLLLLHGYGTQLRRDRLRGDELEDRVVESLLATLGRRDLLDHLRDGRGTFLAPADPRGRRARVHSEPRH